MAKVLAMFPGQGAQYVGMGRDVLSEFPLAKLVFEEAEDSTRLSIRKLCLEGPEDELRLTANTQPCILTLSVAVWRVLQGETGLVPAAFAGHSLGEYSALVAAGKIGLGRAAMLVRRRGEAMQEAVPAGVGAMAAVMNVPAEDLGQRCAKVSKPGRVVEIANYNSPQQLVIAGHKGAVEELVQELEAAGQRSVMLPVSAPFHSTLMQPAREVMTPLLEDTAFTPNATQVIANLTGKLEPDYGPSFLIQQINSPVLWTQSMETAHQQLGCDTYVEMGPGKVLFGLARRILPKGLKLLHTEDVKQTIKDVQAL